MSDVKIEELKENTFNHDWVITNWTNVAQNEELLESTKTEVKCIDEKILYAKFVVGLKLFKTEETSMGVIGFFWKQLSKHYCMENAEAKFVVGVLNSTGKQSLAYEGQACAENGTTTEMGTSFWGFGSISQLTNWVNNEGSMIFKLSLTLKYYNGEPLDSKTAELRNIFIDDLSQNLATLLDNSLCSDLKIVTKENTEHFAHKNILCARCPVFASMFRSDFLESSTGILRVEDISAKTMKILLTYWYTGNLITSWRDGDIVAEFAYAVGKYQMTQVLKMLDDSLGKAFTASDEDVELFKIVERLSLKNAETRMFKRIVDKVRQVFDGAELLEMFGLSTDKIEEDNFGVLQVLKSYDDALSENVCKDATSQGVKLMALACKLEMKNVEKKLLKRVVNTVSKMSSAGELFKLFDLKNEKYSESAEASNLLVRANPIQ